MSQILKIHTGNKALSLFLIAILVACGGGGNEPVTPAPVIPAPASLRVTSSTVPNGSASVVTKPVITLTLNHGVGGGGTTPDQVKLVDSNGPVPVDVRFERSQIVVTPRESLNLKTQYTLTLHAGARADNGAVLSSDYVVSFKTVVASFEAHQLVSAIDGFVGAQRSIVAIGDFDGDGHSDIAVLGRLLTDPGPSQSGYTLLIYRQISPDAVELVQRVDHLIGESGHLSLHIDRLVVMDVDGDGQLEIVVPHYFGGAVADLALSGLQVFKRRPDGLFAAEPLRHSLYVRHLFLSDLDGDGRQDLIGQGSTGTDTGNFAIGFQAWLNTATGLVAQRPIRLGRDGAELAFGDIDRDGKAELLVDSAYSYSGTGSPPGLSIFSQASPGEFALNSALTQKVAGLCTADPQTCIAPLFVDINGDGAVDLMFNHYGDSVPFLQQPDGSFVRGTVTSLRADNLYAKDLDNDGLEDLLIVGHSYQSQSHFVAAGMIKSSAEIEYSPADQIPIFTSLIYPDMVAVGDFTGDGYSDIVVSADSNGVWLMRQTGR